MNTRKDNISTAITIKAEIGVDAIFISMEENDKQIRIVLNDDYETFSVLNINDLKLALKKLSAR